MREDILFADTAGKVVAFPIRTIPRRVAFHNAIVFRNPRIVRPGTPNTPTWGALKVSHNVYVEVTLQFTLGFW